MSAGSEEDIVIDASGRASLRAALDRLRVVTIDAPVVALDRAYAHWPSRDALLWDPPRGPGVAARGAAVCLKASGARLTSDLVEASRAVWRALEGAVPPDAPQPRLWGGFAFAAGAAAARPWQDFGDASFVLPRVAYWRDGGRAWVQVVGAEGRDPLAHEAEAARAALSRVVAKASEAASERPEHRLALPDFRTWHRQVTDIIDAIAAGEVRKVVAAQCTRVSFARAASVSQALANLGGESRGCWRFGFTRNGSTFLGATPEMLILKRGSAIETEALAGTLDKAVGCPEDLLASAKNRNEHELVVEGILEALAPLCAALDVPAVPAVRELRQMYHLWSAVHGVLARPLHVLELCARLHPTPATGGLPRSVAVEKIVATEPTPRGWYAAPVGWFDARSDGELVVALRSGLLNGNDAYVYAGAGIVAGSRAEDEFAETQLKSRAVLRALGVTVP